MLELFCSTQRHLACHGEQKDVGVVSGFTRSLTHSQESEEEEGKMTTNCRGEMAIIALMPHPSLPLFTSRPHIWPQSEIVHAMKSEMIAQKPKSLNS